MPQAALPAKGSGQRWHRKDMSIKTAIRVRSRILEFLIISAWFLFSIGWILLNVRRRRKKLKQQAVNKPESEHLPE